MMPFQRSHNMNHLWNKSRATNLIAHGEQVREFRFKPPAGSYSQAQVFQRADALRLQLEEHHAGQYAISVAVRDKHVAGWRSGRFAPTSDPNIYVWSPELYDNEFNQTPGQIVLPDLVAEQMAVYVRRVKAK